MKSLWSPRKVKHLNRTLNNIKITLLCGFVTILVLRGTIGMGGLRVPDVDLSSDPREAIYVISDMEDAADEEDDDLEFSQHLKYKLGPKIVDWDTQIHSWRSLHFDLLHPARILLVTGSPPTPCTHHVGDHYLLKSIKNKMDYAHLHGFDIFYNMAQVDANMVGLWSKLPLLRKLMLTHPETEWFWWMDSDAMFTDMSFELPLEKYKKHNLILHGWEKKVYKEKTWTGLNTGSFVLRNCQWSLDLLDAWAPMGTKGKMRKDMGKVLSESLEGRPAFEADDQSALIYLLITQREVWGSKVFLENAYDMHGDWINIVGKFEDLMRGSYEDHKRWPFITHFLGCKPCETLGDYSVEKCLKEMERAFNFGDNQVLQKYGYAHKSLSTFKVKQTRNDTSQPLFMDIYPKHEFSS